VESQDRIYGFFGGSDDIDELNGREAHDREERETGGRTRPVVRPMWRFGSKNTDGAAPVIGTDFRKRRGPVKAAVMEVSTERVFGAGSGRRRGAGYRIADSSVRAKPGALHCRE
jgi:hypothetical protein